MGTPLNFAIPEFGKHKATYLLWPNRADNWRESGIFAQRDMRELARNIAEFEPVYLGTNIPMEPIIDHDVTVFPFAYDDIWIRDTGPTFIGSSKHIQAVGWNFNSWGGLLPEYEKDQQVAKLIAERENFKFHSVDFVFEGGAYVADGNGSIFTTKDCIFDPKRNRNISFSDTETLLKNNLGASRILWLESGFLYDETGGHIDNVCFFADAKNLFVSVAQNNNNDNFSRSQEAFQVIHNFNELLGTPYTIHTLPLPQPLEITAQEASGFTSSDGIINRNVGTPMCASYANSYVINNAVIVPKFDIPEDDKAAMIISNALPTHTVIQTPSREFLLGGGSIHCITKEVPFGTATTS